MAALDTLRAVAASATASQAAVLEATARALWDCCPSVEGGVDSRRVRRVVGHWPDLPAVHEVWHRLP